MRQEPSTSSSPSSSAAAAEMAFMAQDGWKSGLTPVQLTKVEALQTDCERLQKEAAQRKLMVENQEQELERQRRKVSGIASCKVLAVHYMMGFEIQQVSSSFMFIHSFIYCLRRSSCVLRYIKYLYLETAYSFQEAVSMLPGLVFELKFGYFDDLIK